VKTRFASHENLYLHVFLNLNLRAHGVHGKHLLSSTEDGSKVDLWHTDDHSGRQKWKLIAGPGYFNIVVHGGVHGGRHFLSVNEDGTKVDLWNHDDGSGRQRWVLEGENIRVLGGVHGPRKYLSTSENGGHIDLWTHDDGSGRQKWHF